MMPFLKLMLFVALAGCIGFTGYMIYRYFNEKIRGSNTFLALLMYALLMIMANAALFLLGTWGLLKIYEQLS
ncbi:MAG: hypothetical protein QM731_16290 [Chitinophagaceae bacterium]